jgi:hypothetical protein
MRLCSKPGCIVEVTKPGYCAPHMAEYMRKHRESTAERSFRKGFEQCRKIAIAQFEVIGDAGMTGWTAATIMRRVDLPEPQTAQRPS